MSGEPEELRLQGKSILIAGSIAEAADQSLSDRARAFAQSLAGAVLYAGGGLVVYASSEPLGENGSPLTFDWLIIRETDRLLSTRQVSPRLTIVTSEKNRQEKMTLEQRQQIARLVSRNAAKVIYLPDELVTGGNIGDEQAEIADAMIAIGGGKGVSDRARKLRKQSAPVLPMDIKVGSINGDGEGAVGLHRQLMRDPPSLMPYTAQETQTAMNAFSLQEPIHEVSKISAGVVDLIANELKAKEASRKADVLILTALPIELAAAKMAFNVAEGTQPLYSKSGISYWRSHLIRTDGSRVICEIACFAGAGNTNAAAITSSLLTELSPNTVIMTGIAAGMRDKCRLGQVVIGERIVAYEGAAVLEGHKVEHRPEGYPLERGLGQDIAGYLAHRARLETRLHAAWSQHGLTVPKETETGPVTDTPIPEQTTIASGEKLLRNSVIFAELRQNIHGKIEVAEMESAGVCSACLQHNTPALVVRGISDFGDSRKDNRFHEFAAKAAAIVTSDIVINGLRPY